MSRIRKSSVETSRCSVVIIKNMPRYAHNVITALLTFTIGVVVATLTPSHYLSVSRYRSHCVGVAENPKEGACYQWEKSAPVSNGLGWDLTYMSLLTNAGVCPGELYCEFAAEKPQPPVDKHFAEWQRDPIISSILIELPDGHADMQATWLIRTKDQAYWSWFHPHYASQMELHPLPTKDYDAAFEAITCWQPQNPSTRKLFDGRGDGYIGFLSLYKEGRSRQMLLTAKDMYDPWPKGWETTADEATWGRLLKTMKPINSAIESSSHKTVPYNR